MLPRCWMNGEKSDFSCKPGTTYQRDLHFGTLAADPCAAAHLTFPFGAARRRIAGHGPLTVLIVPVIVPLREAPELVNWSVPVTAAPTVGDGTVRESVADVKDV